MCRWDTLASAHNMYQQNHNALMTSLASLDARLACVTSGDLEAAANTLNEIANEKVGDFFYN